MKHKHENNSPLFPMFFFLLLSTFLHQATCLVKCKKEILNIFYLNGMEHSIYEPMHVCPGVHDKCCSIGDEIKMKHMYDKHTAPILSRRVAFVMRSIGSTMESFMKMIEIDPNMMVLTYSVPREVFYKEMLCHNTPRSIPTRLEDQRFDRYHKRVGIPKKKKTKKKSKKKPKKRFLKQKKVIFLNFYIISKISYFQL